MCFECLYSLFGGVNAVVIWLVEHEVTVILGERIFNYPAGLVVLHI